MPLPIRKDNRWDSGNIQHDFRAQLRMIYNAPGDPWLIEPNMNPWKVDLPGKDTDRNINIIPEGASSEAIAALTQQRLDYMYDYIRVQMFERQQYRCLDTAAGFELRYRPSQDRVRGFGPEGGRTPVG